LVSVLSIKLGAKIEQLMIIKKQGRQQVLLEQQVQQV